MVSGRQAVKGGCSYLEGAWPSYSRTSISAHTHIFTLTLFSKVIEQLSMDVEIKPDWIEIFTSGRCGDGPILDSMSLAMLLWTPPMQRWSLFLHLWMWAEVRILLVLANMRWWKWQCAWAGLGAFLLLSLGALFQPCDQTQVGLPEKERTCGQSSFIPAKRSLHQSQYLSP